MRFGISATSSIFPKDLRTRLRPVNVCAIVASFFLRPPRMGGGVFRRAKCRPEDGQGGGIDPTNFMPPLVATPVRNEGRHDGTRERGPGTRMQSPGRRRAPAMSGEAGTHIVPVSPITTCAEMATAAIWGMPWCRHLVLVR